MPILTSMLDLLRPSFLLQDQDQHTENDYACTGPSEGGMEYSGPPIDGRAVPSVRAPHYSKGSYVAEAF